MRRLIIVQGTVPHYRVPFFECLTEQYDVAIFHFDKNICGYRDGKLAGRVNCFSSEVEMARKISQEPDAIVLCVAEIRYLILLGYGLFFARNRFVWWGLDEGSSRIANWARHVLFKYAKNILFYSPGRLQRFKDLQEKGVNLFVMNNSVGVPDEVNVLDSKPYFISVGSLLKRKALDKLLWSYCHYRQLVEQPLELVFVGDGPEKKNLMKLAEALDLFDCVKFVGHFDSDSPALNGFYENAIASISMDQAGLSIMQSFGFGVPYITRRSAISGGELDNIINGYNGILLESNSDLVGAMIRLTENKKAALEMGANARRTYEKTGRLEKMALSLASVTELIEFK